MIMHIILTNCLPTSLKGGFYVMLVCFKQSQHST